MHFGDALDIPNYKWYSEGALVKLRRQIFKTKHCTNIFYMLYCNNQQWTQEGAAHTLFSLLLEAGWTQVDIAGGAESSVQSPEKEEEIVWLS